MRIDVPGAAWEKLAAVSYLFVYAVQNLALRSRGDECVECNFVLGDLNPSKKDQKFFVALAMGYDFYTVDAQHLLKIRVT